ncbi:unnamed protein product [Fraxinus pennsylvanica]|uniref:Uncharacterized protein n=1 Tax=Fraxinus pennsylvanica TaxID=56036 RepID=A0AAD2AJ93_9LAMI|nr:unnamed protein product [Fraxinus pennsylvanica]
MAAIATFCSTNHGSGIKKLNVYLLNKHSTTRTHPVFSIPDSRQRLLCYSATDEEKKEDISQATLLWRAVKLPIYSVALVPLTVGSAAAYLQTGLHCARRYFMLLASSVLIITWLNLSNDVYDFDTGADKNKKESVVNIVGSRTGTLIVACLLLVLGFVGLIWVSVEAGSMRSVLLLASAVICGYIYQCPPFRLSYQGLGEPLCFSAFGPFATTAFYLLQSGASELTINGTVISASLLVGFTTSLILFCSHFHQIEEDKAVGKISPLVRLGTEAGSKVVKLAVVTIYSLLFILGLGQTLPSSSVILCALTVPMGNSVVSYVEENHKDKTKIFMAKYYCLSFEFFIRNFKELHAQDLRGYLSQSNTNFRPLSSILRSC